MKKVETSVSRQSNKP